MLSLHQFVQHGYIGLIVAALVERIGIPLLLTPVLVAAGLVAARGELDLLTVVGLTTLAMLVGDQLWFELGRRRGNRVINFLCRISLSKDTCVRRTQVLADRHADVSLLYSKWIPGVAHLAPPMAGSSGMSLARFLALNSIGTFIWVFALTLAGWLSMRPLEWTSVGAAIFGLLPAWLLIILTVNVLWKYVQQRRFIKSLRADRITAQEAFVRINGSEAERPIVIDLRHPLDVLHDPRTIPGALNILPEEIEKLAKDLALEREFILVCT
jgi:membrane protein DedA with SNARE-associated domain